MVIDFSNHEGVEELMAYCVQRGLPLVAATTGYTPEEFQRIQEGAQTIRSFSPTTCPSAWPCWPVWWARPQPFSAAVTWRLWRPTTTERLTPPSGTALLLADAVKARRPDAAYVFGRAGHHPRQPNEIGIHSLRMGNVVGEHEVIFCHRQPDHYLKTPGP